MKKKIIIILAVLLSVVIIFFVAAQIYANKNQSYVNYRYGYSFIFSKKWQPATEISKIFSMQRYTALESAKLNCVAPHYILGIDQKYTEAEINLQNEEYNKCLTNSPDYNKFEDNFKNYQLHWSLYNSDIVYFTDLSADELAEITSEKGISLSKFDLPEGHFISVYLWDDLIQIEEAKYTEKDGNILESKLIDLTYAQLDNVALIDARRLSKGDDGLRHTIDLNIPYTPKADDEYAQQFKSIVVSTDIPYGDSREGVFNQIIKYFKFE